MKFFGRAFVFGHDVDTDAIIPARYLNTTDPAVLAAHAMEDADPSFAGQVRPGDILLAGKNFGCGSSREHAPLALKAAGVACVVAPSFARIFYRNGFNTGLVLVQCPQAPEGFSAGDQVEVDLRAGRIKNQTTGREETFEPIPPFMLELVADGGLIPHLLKKRSQA